MKKIFYSLLVASVLILPACNDQNGEGDEDYADTAMMPGYDDPNYNDPEGGVPVSPDTAQGMDQNDNLPGNETSMRPRSDNTGGNTMTGSDERTARNPNTANSNNGDNNLTRKQGFKASGQYDSRKTEGRPKPVNTDDMYYKENPPAHSYGDTAPRHDGVNSVR